MQRAADTQNISTPETNGEQYILQATSLVNVLLEQSPRSDQAEVNLSVLQTDTRVDFFILQLESSITLRVFNRKLVSGNIRRSNGVR